MQLFVSDKGYVFVVAMKSVSEFHKALKMFAKEVGVPLYLIVDPHKCQKSKEVRQFCHKIGTTLRVLEESTQHADRAELYIGLFKEAIRKDMREAHSPLIFLGLLRRAPLPCPQYDCKESVPIARTESPFCYLW